MTLKINCKPFFLVLLLGVLSGFVPLLAQNDSTEQVAVQEISAKSINKSEKKRKRYEARWLKNLNKAQYYHEKGYYKTAVFLMRIWAKREAKKNPGSSLEAATLLAKAKYMEGMGDFHPAKELFDRGLFILDSNRIDPKYRSLALNIASEAKQEMGEYYHAYYLALLAKYEMGKSISTDLRSERIENASYKQDSAQSFSEHLEQLENLAAAIGKLPASKNYTNHLFFQTDLNLDYINQQRGFYSDAITAIDTLIGHVRSSLETQNKELKRSDKKALKSRLADLLVTKAELYSEMGDYSTANELFAKNSKELKKLDSRKSKSVIRNNLGYALSIRSDERAKDAGKYMRYAFNRAKKSNDISKTSALFYTVFEEQMDLFEEQKKWKKYKKTANKYRRTILLKYRRKSPFYWGYKLYENELLEYFDLKFKKAERRAYKIAEKLNEYYPKKHINNKIVNDQLYAIYIRQSRYDEAEKLLKNNNTLSLWNYGPQSPIHHMSKLDEAMFQITFGSDFSAAEAIYDTSFKLIVRPQLHNNHEKMLPFLNKYGALFEKTDRFQEAIAVYSEAKAIALERFGESSLKYGVAIEKLAGAYIKAGVYEEAEKLLELAVDVVKEAAGRKSIDYVTSLRSLGKMYSINGKYDEARKVIELSYKLSRKVSDQAVEFPEINSIEEMAELYITTGNYDGAEEILQESINSRTKKFGDNTYQLITPFQLLGEVYLLRGDYNEAEKNVQKASDIALKTRSDTSSKYIEAMPLLSEIHAEMGRYGDAKENMLITLGGNEKIYGKDHINVASSLLDLAELELSSEESEEEVSLILDRALDIYADKLGTNHPDYARNLELIAINQIQQGAYDAAKLNLESAKKIYLDKFGEKSINVGENEMRLGDLAYYAGNSAEASERFESALSIFKGVFDKYHPKYVQAQGKLARANYALGNYKEAAAILENTSEKYLEYIAEYFPTLSDKEKNKYWNSIRGDFELYNSLALKYSDENPKVLGTMYNNKLATKAILLSSSIKLRQNILSSNDEDLIALFEDWLAKKELLTRSFSMSQEELLLKSIDRVNLAKEINTLEKALSAKSEAFASSQSEIYSWKDVRKSLREKEVAVEIIRFNYFDKNFSDSVIYAALIIKPENKKGPELVVLPDGNKLESRYYKGYRNSIKFKMADKYSYKYFWEPIDQRIDKNKSIFLSADGVYNQVNVETLKDDAGQYIIDKNDIVLLSNTKDIVIFRNKEKEKKDKEATENLDFLVSTAALFGNPDFTSDIESTLGESKNTVSSFEALPGAEKEVKELNDILKEKNWNTETYIQKEAIEAQVKKLESPRVFHIATHGFFVQESKVQDDILMEAKAVDNPLLKSGLLFSGSADLLGENIYNFNKRDGVLTAYEAMNLKLDHTELVVLSACETGLGEVKAGEGVYGLQRSFLVAGAQNVIMTLFKVNDQVTQELITTFYKYWLSTGNKRLAFSMAKKQVKNKYPEPIFWGSFVMIGMD